MNRKHAYLIIAHNEPKLFHILMSLLDDYRNDIFVLIDKKSDKHLFEFQTQHSKLYYVEQVNIRWGEFSMVTAELILMDYASSKDKYDYYHLLSGVDLPIKSQDYIHHFFDSLNSSKELVGFVPKEDESWKLRIWYYFPFLKNQRPKNKAMWFIVRIVTKIMLIIQKGLKYKRKWTIDVRKGTNWFSITDELCRYIVGQKEYIKELFSNVICCDEVFLQTLLYNKFPERIYNINSKFGGNLREIDWNRGIPYVWGQDDNDFELLMKSEALFARKFSMKYSWIIEKIEKELM